MTTSANVPNVPMVQLGRPLFGMGGESLTQEEIEFRRALRKDIEEITNKADVLYRKLVEAIALHMDRGVRALKVKPDEHKLKEMVKEECRAAVSNRFPPWYIAWGHSLHNESYSNLRIRDIEWGREFREKAGIVCMVEDVMYRLFQLHTPGA